MPSAKKLSQGDRAPAFRLPTDKGAVALTEFKGKTVVLYFYPKDDTSGCTKQAIAFTEDLAKFKRAGAVVIGVSRDSVERHEKFRAKHKLKIELGSDEKGEVLKKYGVWVEKSMYGRKFMGIERSTFVIDGSGKIHRIWRKVRVAGHADEVLSVVKELKSKK